jgi:SAM-dependent methyltransferase
MPDPLTGIWNNEETMNCHEFDEALCDKMVSVFGELISKYASILDIGCGLGDYVDRFRAAGWLFVSGVDGNPPKGKKYINKADLTHPLETYSSLDGEGLVISLEVAEHIPPEFMEVFMDNVVCSDPKWILLSWAIPDQFGIGHVNCRSNEYVQERMAERGYSRVFDVETSLREAATLPWFLTTLMFFRRTVST